MNEKCLGDDYLGQLLALQHCKSLRKTEQLQVLEYSSNIRSITGQNRPGALPPGLLIGKV